MAACFECDNSTLNPENEYGEHVCDDCEQSANERAWERHCESFHAGEVISLREMQIEARRLK
jgi:hypothetical protein